MDCFAYARNDGVGLFVYDKKAPPGGGTGRGLVSGWPLRQSGQSLRLTYSLTYSTT